MSRAPQSTPIALVPELRLTVKQDMKCISLKNLTFLQKVKIHAYKYIIHKNLSIYTERRKHTCKYQ